MLTVGQELWYVPADARRHDQAQVVRVTKVGRKWADLEPSYLGRVNIKTLWLDGGGSSPGRCWFSADEYEAAVARERLWNDFKNRLSHYPPDGATVEWIREAAKTLGIQLQL